MKITNFPSVIYRPFPLLFIALSRISGKASRIRQLEFFSRSCRWRVRDFSLRHFDRAAGCDGQTDRRTPLP